MDDQDHMHEPLVKEGYAYAFYPVRWKAYKPGAPTNKKGRWQRMKEYGGWENCDKPAEVFHSPDLIEARAAQLQEAREVVGLAEGFIAASLPYYAADRNYAVDDVLPALRAFLAKSQ
jgi:hypothetical protein